MTDPAVSPRGLAVKQSMPLGRVRRVMAQTMRDSVQRAALSQVSREMDLTAVVAARRAMSSHPLLNAELLDDRVLVYEPVNLGMAVAVPDGLIVVVLRDAHQKGLAE